MLEDDEPLSPSVSYGKQWHFTELGPMVVTSLRLGAESLLCLLRDEVVL